MVCVECRALLEECTARSGLYRRAVEEYRRHIRQGSGDTLMEDSRLRMQLARESMKRVRAMYDKHVVSH